MNLLTRELLARSETIHIPSRQKARFHERGEKTSLRKGSSLEFSDYREYLQGDDIRTIDWNVYARTERLYLKLFLEEQSKPVYFLVDASESMKFGNPSKFDFARALAGLLIYSCLRRYDRPHVIFLRAGSHQRLTFHTRKQFFPLLEKMEAEKCSGEISMNQALRQVAHSRLPRGVYFVLSDFYSIDGLDALHLLAASGNELNCLQILSQQELQPELRGDLRLLDSETGKKSEVSVSPQILKKYHTALHRLQSRLKTAAMKSAATYYCVSSNSDLGTVLFQDLRRKGIVA